MHTTEQLNAALAGRDSLIYESKERRFFAEDWSEDGETLLIRRTDTLYALPMTADRKPVVLAGIKEIDEVRYAPGGRQLSYGSNESGTWQVYVADYPSLDNRRQVSASGGRQARWKRDGKELYFLSSDGKVMVAALRPGSAGEFAAPEVLFQSPLSIPSPVIDQWDVDANGRRFLFLVPEAGAGLAYPMTVVLHWTHALNTK